MKKKNLLISALLVCFLSSCGGTSETPTPQPSENAPTTDVSESTSTPVSEHVSQNQFAQELAFLTDSFVISNINDTFNVNETKKYYKLIADHDDEYAFITYNYLKLTLLDSNYEVITEEYDEIVATLKKNQEVYLIVEQMNKEDQNIQIEAYYMNDPVKLPYQTNFIEEEIDASYSDERGILKPAEISYKGREGGTYIYSNNPEMFSDRDLNKCLMKNENLTGEVYMAFENLKIFYFFLYSSICSCNYNKSNVQLEFV